MIAYCDFIADRIRKGLLNTMNDSLEPVRLKEIGSVGFDLGSKGEFMSTKKTMYLWDAYGKEYRVTVEEV
jgi:hypothetical protein